MRAIPMLAAAIAACLAALPARADTLVRRDGAIREGDFEKSPDGARVQVGTTQLPLEDVLWWEDDDKRLVHAADPAAMFAGLRVLGARAERALALSELPKAVEAEDRAAARALLARAERAGLDPAEAERWADRIAALPAEGGEDYEPPARRGELDVLVERAGVAFDDDDESVVGMRLLRAALAADGDYGPARDLLDLVGPERFRIGDPRTDDIGRLWLDWTLEVLASDVRLLSRRHPYMARARGGAWGRTDLLGLGTDDVVFITPLEDASAVRMCLDYAGMTCGVLGELFATDDPQRLPEDDLPLMIYFYENKEEYVTLSGRGRGFGENPGLAMTAGHYVSSENVSRFFMPTGPDARKQIRDTFVHELTHHWIERRNPRWHARDLKELGERVQTPGFWIVEGMAVFIEEGRYDIETGGKSLFAPKANSMDVVVALGREGKLIDWERFYGLTQAGFNTELDKEKPIGPFRPRWRPFPISTLEIRLFYEQAASTVHYLYWAEDGRYRDALKRYVTSYYTSQADQCAIPAAFGMEPGELGRRVEAHAKRVIEDGWRPGEG